MINTIKEFEIALVSAAKIAKVDISDLTSNMPAAYGEYKNKQSPSTGDNALASVGGVILFIDGATEKDEVVSFEYSIDAHTAHKYIQTKESARRRGLQFNLSLASIKNILRAKKCFYTGIELTIGGHNPTSVTIDRVDASKGYIIGNVVACSHVANQFKGTIEHSFDGLLDRAETKKVIIKMFSAMEAK